MRPASLAEKTDEKQLNIKITGVDGKEREYPIFQQKAENYGKYNEYMTHHGCACCSLTTLLAAYVPEYRNLRPDQTILQVEKKYFPKAVWQKNYSRHKARQMPVSLYGISLVLQREQIAHRYVRRFEDPDAIKEIREHLLRGRPVVIETSRMKRKNGRIVKWFDKKFAGSYHTMIILGLDKDGSALFTDSATRAWSGDQQRLKKAALEELITYMFPQKKTEDIHVYFTRRKNTGGYILVDE